MMTEEFMNSIHLRALASSIAATETGYKKLWEAVRPKVGEVWEKKPCAKGLCSIGWSFGVGVVTIKDDRNSYGDPHHIVCGCLVKVK